MPHDASYQYLQFDGEEFFTIVLLPEKDGQFPVVVCRNPYVKNTVDMPEDAIVQEYYTKMKSWLERGYAVVYQHCRGQGKSTGAFVPYVHEREDGLALRAWIRTQPFYNGELFLLGGSYTASLHYATAPFEEDIKGAVFEVQDSERYRLWFRNGQMRKGHADWHFQLYKAKCGLDKCFDMRSFGELPLNGLSERVLGDRADDFEEMLPAFDPAHPFWQTCNGGAECKDAVSDTHVPVLLTTSYNDFYIGGVFKMWERMTEKTRQSSALLVSPYNHGDSYDSELGLPFEKGKRKEGFGEDYQILWFDHIRKSSPLRFEKGKVTYYRAFEKGWESDFYKSPTTPLKIALGEGEKTFVYDPKTPPAFRAEGLLAEDFENRADILTRYTPNFEKDTFVKGQMQLNLTVSSTAPDTAFYVRVSVEKPEGTYVLRHDITSLCYQLGNYQKNTPVPLHFCFDEYAYLIKKGERLRIDVASADDNSYVCHTNKKGAYHLQTASQIATNTVYWEQSYLTLPVE